MSEADGSESVSPDLTGPAWSRLQEQIAWYDTKSMRAMAFYKTLKVFQIVVAASIPVVAGAGVSGWVTGALGSTIVVVEGIQQLFRFHEYWLSYRAACEALRQEMFLYEAAAGNYRTEQEPDRLLAERMNGITSQEVARWTSLHTAEKKEASG
ncbi:MAG TPA: DUF4231 domain-containing protein [Acidimicrobiales bacterium]|nr:DUF4231 domain-containing protein [Acidimicrobiales bacterium]